MQQRFHSTPILNAQFINSYKQIGNRFSKVGDLECSGACLVRRNWVGGPHTQVDPLLARLPWTPPVPELLVDRTRSAPLELLLATPPAMLYDTSA
jgi:hypothetical protein